MNKLYVYVYLLFFGFPSHYVTMEHWIELPVLYNRLSLVIYFLWLLSLICVQLFCHIMDCTSQAPLLMGFSRQGYWRGLPFPSSGDLPSPGIRSTCLALQADSLPLNHWGNSYFTRSITSVYPTPIPQFIPSLLLFLLGIHTFVLYVFVSRIGQPLNQWRSELLNNNPPLGSQTGLTAKLRSRKQAHQHQTHLRLVEEDIR